MEQLLSNDLWPTVKRLGHRAARKRAAVAYVTSEEFVEFGEGDVLITDASDRAISAGHTNAKLLARMLNRGASLYSVPGLHAKVFLLGGTAVIGSANLSESSATNLVEAAWVTDSPSAVGMVTSLIQQLITQADVIDEAFVTRIRKIKVKGHPKMSGRTSRAKKVKIPEHRTWVVGVHEMVKDIDAEQQDIEAGTAVAEEKVTRAASDVSWIRWTGSSRFRGDATEGDTVIQIWSGHKAKRPSAVYRHAPIIHRQDETSCTRFFVEDFADCHDTSIAWGEFKKLARRVGLEDKIGPTSARPIAEASSTALFALWGE